MKPNIRSFSSWLLACAAITVPMSGAASPPVAAVSVADPTLPQSASAGGDSFALALTPDGAFVLFTSTAGNLVPNDQTSGFIDLFLRCRTNGAVTLVSANTAGAGGGNGDSGYASVSPDSRYVVFQSDASDLVTNDTNQASDIFVRDTVAGTTTLVSVNQAGTASGNGPSSSPVITPDGRYVAFVSAASNLVASPEPTYQEIYVRDRTDGQTIWASTNVTASSNAPASAAPVLSDDGQFVAFSTAIGNSLLVLRRNLQAGALDVISTNAASGPEITPEGRFAAFADAVTNTRNTSSVWRWDAQTGSNLLVSANLAGRPSADGLCDSPAITPDGRFVTFLSDGSDLVTNDVSDVFVTNDLNGAYDVFVRDTVAGTTESCRRARRRGPSPTPSCAWAISGNSWARC